MCAQYYYQYLAEHLLHAVLWCHVHPCCAQALASERELLVSLFGSEGMDDPQQQQQQNGASGGRQEAATPRAQLQQQQDMHNTAALLDQVFESICRPLKVCLRPASCYLDIALKGASPHW